MNKRIVVFASGSGSNFKNIVNKIKLHKLSAKIYLLVSNNPNCEAVNFAKRNGIDIFIYNSKIFPNDKNQIYLSEKLISYNLDLILLAGYMKKISTSIVNKYKNKILNIHPSLLPLYGGKGFYGLKVHNEVHKNNEEESGATVHFIDSNYDTGPILIQKKIKLEADISVQDIADRVLKVEHEIYFKALKLFCHNKIYWKNNKPLIKG